MNIILDAMSGDKAPLEIIKGAVLAKEKLDVSLTLVGDIPTMERIAAEQNLSLKGIELCQADEVVTMEDDPISVVRAKRNSSMAVGLRLLKEKGDAFVSAGNTGALHAGSSLIIRPVKGIHRSAIATVLPMAKPVLMLDCGANVNVTPEYLVQWAAIGSVYMQNIFGIEHPTVGLLNNGTEAHKGTPVIADTYKRLREESGIRFIGNVEGNHLVNAPCDVLVTDGFTGNVTLKFLEGMGKFFMTSLKGMFTHNTMTKMAFLAMRDQLHCFKKQFDSSEYGGAPLLGLSKPVIKAHGSSDAQAICSAVRQASAFVRTGVIEEIAEYARACEAKKSEEREAAGGESEQN